MESNINKLRMKEILNRVGFPVTINEFRNTYKFNVNLDTAIEFENKLKQIKKISDIERIICEYEDIFDKEIYVFHIARLLEQDIESMKRAMLLEKNDVNQLVFTNDETGKNKRRFFVNAKNLLKNCDVIDIVMKKKSKGEFEIYLSKDFVEQNTQFSEQREKAAEEKLKKIEEKIGLKNVLAYLKNSDLTEICRYPNLAILLIVNQEKLEKNIRKYIQYIDIDKMLVLANAVYFYKHGENFYKFSREDAAELKKFTKSVSQIVGNNVKFLQSSRFYFTIDFNEIKEKVQKMFDFESLENLNQTNGLEIERKAEELAKEIINLEMTDNEENTSKSLDVLDDKKETSIQESNMEVNAIEQELDNNIEVDNEENNIEVQEKNSDKMNDVAEEFTNIDNNKIENVEEEHTTQEANIEVNVIEQEIENIETESSETENNETENNETENNEIENNEIENNEIENNTEDDNQEKQNEETAENYEENDENNIEEKAQKIENNAKVEHQYISRFVKAENKILMDFENRRNTIFKVDENSVQEDLEDGASIFYLPNKECYIIELEKSSNNFGGNATYIIDKGLFENQKNRIVENQKINPKELSTLKLENNKSVTKLVYTGWEDSIATFFNMKTEEKYTEDEILNIKKIVENKY